MRMWRAFGMGRNRKKEEKDAKEDVYKKKNEDLEEEEGNVKDKRMYS